jgi:hypothetical protein
MTGFSSEMAILRALIGHLAATGVLSEEEFADLLDNSAHEAFHEGHIARAQIIAFAASLRPPSPLSLAVIDGGLPDEPANNDGPDAA